MGDAGTPGGRFERAIHRRNALAAISAAAELQHISLARALQLVLVLRASRDEMFPRAAGRFVERWLGETRGATVDEARELSQGLVHLDGDAMCATLARVFRGRAQHELERVVTRWLTES